MSLIARLSQAFLSWPSGGQWLMCGWISAVCLIALTLLAWCGGLLGWRPRFDRPIQRLAMAFVVPALGEEAVFRALLLPRAGQTLHPIVDLGFGVAIFTLWHVFEGLTFLTAARRIFLNAWFLACAAVLGLDCAVMQYFSGSVWPGVFLHTGVVFVWQSGFGGLELSGTLRPPVKP